MNGLRNRTRALRHGEVRRPRRTQRGQAMIEFSMFAVFLFTLAAGVADVGSLLDDHENVVFAARQGARTGSVLGPQTAADCAIVGAVHASVLNQSDLSLQQIIIYKSDANGLPTVVGGTVQEDVYPGYVDCVNGAIVDGRAAPPQPTVAPTVNNWPPSSRSNTPFTEDSLGVELDYTFQWRFNLFGTGSLSGVDRSVFPINVTTSG